MKTKTKTRKANVSDKIALVVTTEHKGVFFGYGVPTTEKTIRIEQARMCVYSRQYYDALIAPFVRDGSTVVFWRSNKDGAPANGGSGTKAAVGLVEVIDGPLSICTEKALHGTIDPTKWKGERWWIVALQHPVQIDGDKVGSLKRTFLADLGPCPFK